MWDGPANRLEWLLHRITFSENSARLVRLASPRSRQFEFGTRTCDHRPLYHHQGPWCDHLFHDRLTCASSRCRCSRPERGQSKVPFSQCRCHILLIDYRWGSMGSDETATATSGGPRVIGVFYGNGAPSGPNFTFFSGADRLLYASRGRSDSG